MTRHDPHPQGCDRRHNPPREFDVRDEEMICKQCATKSTADPHRPGIKHQSDQWDELKESGKCVRCLVKEIDQLREWQTNIQKKFLLAIEERDLARAYLRALHASRQEES